MSDIRLIGNSTDPSIAEIEVSLAISEAEAARGETSPLAPILKRLPEHADRLDHAGLPRRAPPQQPRRFRHLSRVRLDVPHFEAKSDRWVSVPRTPSSRAKRGDPEPNASSLGCFVATLLAMTVVICVTLCESPLRSPSSRRPSRRGRARPDRPMRSGSAPRLGAAAGRGRCCRSSPSRCRRAKSRKPGWSCRRRPPPA